MWCSNLANKLCYYSGGGGGGVADQRHFDASPNPDPASHFDADPDPDPDPSFQIEAQNLEKMLT